MHYITIKLYLGDELSSIKGIGWKLEPQQYSIHQKTCSRRKNGYNLPGYAWDLLPYDKKPLDLYRSHVWHGNFNEDMRSPYAAIYTSLDVFMGANFA